MKSLEMPGIFSGDVCVNTGLTTLVMIDRTTRKPVVIPDDFRAVLVGLM